LSEVARVAIRANPADISHDAVSRYLDVSAEVRGRSVGSAGAEVTRALAKATFPLEYHAEVLGAQEEHTSHAAFLSYVAAALIGIFLLLHAALGSWRVAALMLLAIPVALSGGVLVALVSSNAGSLGAMAGLLAVLALAVRHAVALAGRIR